MKKINYILAVIITVLLLNGCAALGARRDIPEEEKIAIHSIGVYSYLGNDFHSTYIGTTAFNNKSHDMDVTAWGIDSYAITQAIKILNSMGYEAMSLASAPADLNAVKIAAREAGVDALVLIDQSGSYNLPHYKAGYGFHRRSAFGIQRDCTYSLFITHVYAADSGKELGWEWGYPALTAGLGCYGKMDNGEPWTQEMEWRESPADYSEEEVERFKQDILQSVSESVSYSLTHVGL